MAKDIINKGKRLRKNLDDIWRFVGILRDINNILDKGLISVKDLPQIIPKIKLKK